MQELPHDKESAIVQWLRLHAARLRRRRGQACSDVAARYARQA
ncbi:hypothetical protein OOT46_08060 [Aquabacterium sp. A7-Y]|nr:hypothetical protein [Aquabacterium sp. A7-Y]MCW7537803.1 hypothetical protein [Aquabacterium sp. A7-Y]